MSVMAALRKGIVKDRVLPIPCEGWDPEVGPGKKLSTACILVMWLQLAAKEPGIGGKAGGSCVSIYYKNEMFFY